MWVDDPVFDPARQLRTATGELEPLVDEILSSPLPRDRPLWGITIVDGERLALVGKMHHFMVDGTAVVQLGNLLLDAHPDARNAESPAYTPSSADRFARAMIDRTGDLASLALTPIPLATRPHGLPGAAARGVRTGVRTVLPPAPGSPLNQPVSARRHHLRVTRSLDEIRTVRRHFGVRPNGVLLAAAAGALRRFFEERERASQVEHAL